MSGHDPRYIYQAYQVLGVTYGWSFEGLFEAEWIPHAKIHWLSVSAKEWMASENMEADPEYAHPTTFNTKLTAFLEKKNIHIQIQSNINPQTDWHTMDLVSSLRTS